MFAECVRVVICVQQTDRITWTDKYHLCGRRDLTNHTTEQVRSTRMTT